MTPTSLQSAIESLALSPTELARLVGVHVSVPYKWLNGQSPIPRSVELVIDLALASAANRRRLGLALRLSN